MSFADAQGKGREAAGAMREVSDNFVEAIDESIKTRPYTTLAIVAGLGFSVRRDVAALMSGVPERVESDAQKPDA